MVEKEQEEEEEGEEVAVDVVEVAVEVAVQVEVQVVLLRCVSKSVRTQQTAQHSTHGHMQSQETHDDMI